MYNHTPAGTISPVEHKLVELGKVRGIVAGYFRQVSQDTHFLMASLATSWPLQGMEGKPEE